MRDRMAVWQALLLGWLGVFLVVTVLAFPLVYVIVMDSSGRSPLYPAIILLGCLLALGIAWLAARLARSSCLGKLGTFAAVLAVPPLIISLFLIATEAPRTPAQQALLSVQSGMSRADAIRTLHPQSWYEALDCPPGTSTKTSDLYFFGSRVYGKSDVVVVESSEHNERTHLYVVDTVYQVTGVPWAPFSACIDRAQFEQ